MDDTRPFSTRNIIRFHRIYRDNWFFLGRYEFDRQNTIWFPTAFMFQGQFFIYEDDRRSKNLSDYYFGAKIHFLDHETDQFVEQKIEINIDRRLPFNTFKILV